MKHSSRKFLSLLMAFAIVLSLLPTALAADGEYQDGSIRITSSNTTGILAPGETATLEAVAPSGTTITNADWFISEGVGAAKVSGTLGTASVTAGTDVASETGFAVTVEYLCEVPDETLTTKYRATLSFTIIGSETEPVVTSVTISPSSSKELTVGEEYQLTATVRGDDGVSEDVTWNATGSAVTVDEYGNVTAVRAGTSTVTATSVANGADGTPVRSNSVTITVKAVEDTPTISLTKNLSLSSSTTGTSHGTVTAVLSGVSDPDTLSLYTVRWSTNAPTVAYFSSDEYTDANGRVMTSFDVSGSSYTSPLTVYAGSASGTATITALLYRGNEQLGSATCSVTVTGTSTPRLTLSNSSVSLASGATGQLIANLTGITAAERSEYSVEWKVNYPNVVEFSSSTTGASVESTITYFGTALSGTAYTSPVILRATSYSGQAIVTAQLYHGAIPVVGQSATCTVTVGTTSLPLTPSSVSVGNNQVTNYTVRPTVTSWPTGYYVDWTVTSGTGSAWISTTNSTVTSQNWGVSVRTTISNGIIPGVYVYGRTSGTATLTAVLKTYEGRELARNSVPITVGTTGFTISPTPSTASVVNLNNYWNSNSSGYYYDFSVDPRLNGTSIRNRTDVYDIYYTWKVNGNTVQSYNTGSSSNYYNSYAYRLYASNQYLNSNYWNSTNRYNTLSCTVEVYDRGASQTTGNRRYYDSVTWNVTTGYSSQFTVSATIYDSNPGYALTDTPDGSTTSIADQIDTWVRRNYYNTTGTTYRSYDVHVYGGTAYESGTSGNHGTLTSNSNWLSYSDLNKIVFTPGSTVSTSTGSYQVSFNFDVRLYNYNSYNTYDTVSGTMVFTVKQGTAAAGNINYSASIGEDVYFNVSDFENFWSDIYSRGTLSYVTFGSVSGGTVYNSSNKSVGTTKYYANPSSSQSALDGTYFSPNSTTSKSATTVRIPFTAYGSTASGSSASSTSRTGTIVITYLSAAASTISYSTTTNGTVSLKAQDFIDAYKAAVKTSSNPSNLTIVFQNVPSYGTLTYKDSSKSSSSSVKLTNSNIKSRSYTTKTSGSNQIGDVTYTASSSRTETISYIGYIGNTATFTGEVSFNGVTAPTNVPVNFACYTTAGVPMSYSSFSLASPTAMAAASYITFGTPRTGKLVNTTGTTASGTAIPIAQLGNVTYVPSTAATVGTDSFSFTAYTVSGVVAASGTVTVTVSLPATNPGAITSISQFTDIPAAGPQSDWYRPQLTYLINKGVINGKGNGKFGPEDALTYGEALKMIMNAAGYTEPEADENKAGVSHWAQNYKNTAVQRGWLASSVDLKATISRDSMAELTAKVLGITPAADTSNSPFADSTNAYAIGLYNSKIVQGELWDDGSRHFTPKKALTRNEMVCLVYNMYQFTGK